MALAVALVEGRGDILADGSVRARLAEWYVVQSEGVRLTFAQTLAKLFAERVLGLPGDIRVDREPAFEDVLSGAA